MALLALLLAAAGCHDLATDAKQGASPLAKDPPSSGLSKGAAAKMANPAASTPPPSAATADRAALAHGEWIQAVERFSAEAEDAEPLRDASFHWRHPPLEDLLGRPTADRVDFRPLLADKDPVVAGNAAIGLARQGDAGGAERLAATVRAREMRLPMRCAAVEALAALPDAASLELLRRLADQYGYKPQKKPLPANSRPAAAASPPSSPYLPALHAELVRGLARRVDADKEPRIAAALASPAPAVRIEALRAWAASRNGDLPPAAADLRNNSDPRVRAAALQTLVAHRHPQAKEWLAEALRNVALPVRLAAISGLGGLGDSASQAALRELLKERVDGIRAAAATALAHAGAKQVVLEAAGDASWRVRLQVARALAAWPDGDAAAVARRLLDDQSAEVQRKTVLALSGWPVEAAGPLLLEAMGKLAFSTRKAAAEELAARWEPAAQFVADGPPPRRKEILDQLQVRFHQQFAAEQTSAANPLKERPPDDAAIQRVQRLLDRQDFQGMKDFGPGLPQALERLVVDRFRTLPEPVYRDVLPQYQPVFATLVRLASPDLAERRLAAADLIALSQKGPLGRLAVERLAQQVATEADPVVWQSALAAIACDASEPAGRLACAGMSHPADEVRRRACEHLAAHPRPEHRRVLVLALEDRSHAVVLSAIRALGALGRLDDPRPLRKMLAANDEQVVLESASALARLGDPTGRPALERMTYSDDPKIRARTADALGALGDPSLAAALVRMLDDPRVGVACAALVNLPKVVGRDVAEQSTGALLGTTEQIRRWKQWYAQKAAGSDDLPRR